MFKLKALSLAICFLIVVLNLTGCGQHSRGTSTPSVTTTQTPTLIQTITPNITLYFPTNPLGVHANPNKNTYLPGEAVEIQFSFKNKVELPIQISPIPPTIEIRQLFESGSSWIVQLFEPGTGLESLNPGASFSFTLTWDQHNKDGHQVESGQYNIVVKNINIQDTEGKTYGLGEATPGMFIIE